MGDLATRRFFPRVLSAGLFYPCFGHADNLWYLQVVSAIRPIRNPLFARAVGQQSGTWSFRALLGTQTDAFR